MLGSVAELANRDVETEDAGQLAHPREPMRGDIEQPLVAGGPGDGRPLALTLRNKQQPQAFGTLARERTEVLPRQSDA